MSPSVTIGAFSFRAAAGELVRDGRATRLTPRAAAVLQALAQRAPEIVTKAELLQQVWQGLAVGDDALTSSIQEVRRALGDRARTPSYIETCHRRGYRLIAATSRAAPVDSGAHGGATMLFGREAELRQLEEAYDKAREGRRQLVFVSGEPGMGKSSLLSAFLTRVRAFHPCTAFGQCVEHHGAGEAYLPLIEAMQRLASEDERFRDALVRNAPNWFAQMPTLWADEPPARPHASNRGRMLRELSELLEAASDQRVLVLGLEDLHWSDPSTLDWLNHLAPRRETARLMVVATLRPGDALHNGSPVNRLVADLTLRGLGAELGLAPLSVTAIEAMVAQHAPAAPPVDCAREAQTLLARTGGNPLFITGLLAMDRATGLDNAASAALPKPLARFIDERLDRLSASARSMLAAASVVGRHFDTATVAAILDAEVEEVEVAFSSLAATGEFVLRSGVPSLPYGGIAEQYAFRHDLHRERVYERQTTAWRRTAHVRAGRRLELAWAPRLDEIAAALADHAERAGEPDRAVRFHQLAAARAMAKSANREAIGHLQGALAAADASGSMADARTYADLLISLGGAYIGAEGFGAGEVLDTYARAEAFCDPESEQAFAALWGQWMFHSGRGETPQSRRIAQRLLDVATAVGLQNLKLQARHASWSTAFGAGDFTGVLAHAESGLALFDCASHAPRSFGNHDAGCCAHNSCGMALALMGRREEALAASRQAIEVASQLDDPFSHALACFFGGAAAQMLGEGELSAERAVISLRLASQHDLAQPRAWSLALHGYSRVIEGDAGQGLAALERAVEDMNRMRSGHLLPYLWGLLAEGRLRIGQTEAALAAAASGVGSAESIGEAFHSGELHRLRGEARARLGRGPAAAAAFDRAEAIAAGQAAQRLIGKIAASRATFS